MTLATLHARFLQHCAVEKRLRPMTIKSYRSDFGLFLQFLRRRRRSQTLSPPGRGQGEGPGFRSLTTAVIRDYQAHMATRRWSVNTVRRRLVELNRFAGWLVERRYLQRSPMIGISVPRRARRLPRVLDWSQVEQIVAGERKPRDRAILALLAYGGLRRGEVMAADVGDYSREAPSLMVHGKGNKDRVVPLHAVAQGALDAYLATRRGLAPEHPLSGLSGASRRRGGFVSQKMMGRPTCIPVARPSRPEVIRLPALPRASPPRWVRFAKSVRI